MKLKSKLTRWMPSVMAGLALAVSGGFAYGASDIIFGPDGTEASINNSDGTWINMWGPAHIATTFDSTTPPPTGDTTGSVYNQGDWTGDSGGMDNYNMISPGNWWGDVVFDGSQYASIEMDIKYDTTSTMTPTSAAHLSIGFDTGYNFVQITNESFDTASSPLTDGKWHHLSIPIPASQSGIGSADGVGYYQWNPAGTSGTMSYWMANVQLIARVVPVAPPTLSPPVPASVGLNVFASTEGNSFYDRQEAELIQNSGLSWVGQATVATPVTYSFTITNYPKSVNCEAFLFLVPNPAGNDNAPDWNETNCLIAYIQGSSSSATLHFEYKVGEDHQQAMYSGGSETRTIGTPATSTNNYYYAAAPGSLPNGPITNVVSPGVFNITNESGNLGWVTNNSVLGTWTVKFTSNSSVTLIAPDGNTTNLVFPAYNAAEFAETQSPDAFNIYLGMQANNADAMNQAVVYAGLSIANITTPFAEDFLTDTALDTTNTWDIGNAAGPKGVLIVPAGSAYWVNWTLPYSGFSLLTGTNLSNLGPWTSPSLGPIIPLFAREAQLVAASEVPAGPIAFFNMIKRTATQLQVLLPGETSAPGTATGKTGTPTVESVDGLVTVTVNMVDSTWHLVSSSDSISLSSSTDPSAGTATGSLVGGTVQITDWYFDTAGSQTITATDTTSTNILSNTSSAVTAQ